MVKLEIHHSAVPNKIIDKTSSIGIKIVKWKVVEVPHRLHGNCKKKQVPLKIGAGCHIHQTDRTTWNYIWCNKL